MSLDDADATDVVAHVVSFDLGARGFHAVVTLLHQFRPTLVAMGMVAMGMALVVLVGLLEVLRVVTLVFCIGRNRNQNFMQNTYKRNLCFITKE